MGGFVRVRASQSCSIAWASVLRICTSPYCVLYGRCAVLYCTVLHCTYCTVLYCPALQDNLLRGRFLAELTREVFGDLEQSKYQHAEMRISVYGRKQVG